MKNQIAIFGEVLADIFPDQSVLGGAPYNVARHLQAFGLQSLMISCIGNDALGQALLSEMRILGMDCSGIQLDSGFPTGQVKVITKKAGHSYEILPDQAYDHIKTGLLDQLLTGYKPALAYFGTLALRSKESRMAAKHFLQCCDCPRFVDINLRKPWYNQDIITFALEHADMLKINHEELQEIAGLLALGATDPYAQAKTLQQRFALSLVLVTCAEAGSWLLTEDQQIFRTSSQEPATLVDTVGAGDAYTAVFITGLLNGWDMQASLDRASEFASAICSIRGAAPTSADFYQPYLASWRTLL